ncbi:GrlR family regulatory protein [Pseudomonas sp.]|uniref:GrlR family regulatory protein n=1 Tax=Pseudomonas sp. TaxID=306 RepID=UPI003C7526A4
MKDGIYHVRFFSNMQDMGEGIAVFQGASVNGGDGGYTYSGRKQGNDQGFTATLTIKRWNTAWQSVFGPLDEFQLQFQGKPDAAGFDAEGSIVGQPEARITARGQFLFPAS